MKIHAAVRLNNEVYLPNNDEHAVLLAERLNDRQKIRLSESGSISGPGSEVDGVTHVRTKAGELDDTGGVITKSPTKKTAAKKKAEAKAKKDKAAADKVAKAEAEAAETEAAKAAENSEEEKSTKGEGSGGEGWPDQAPE